MQWDGLHFSFDTRKFDHLSDNVADISDMLTCQLNDEGESWRQTDQEKDKQTKKKINRPRKR